MNKNISIQPSEDFKDKTMLKIKTIERRLRLLRDAFFMFLGAAPFLVRESWLLLRGDYFSVASMPLGHYIIVFYQFMISPYSIYLFGLFALGFSLLYWFSAKKNPIFLTKIM